MNDNFIPGGFVLLARKMCDADLMDAPALYLKLWVWLLLNANFKDHGKIKRGEVLTTVDTIRDALTHYVGARPVRPTYKQIRKPLERFTAVNMIAKRRTTRGLVITILKFNTYQVPGNYERQGEGQGEGSTKGLDGANDKGRMVNKNEKNDNYPVAGEENFIKLTPVPNMPEALQLYRDTFHDLLPSPHVLNELKTFCLEYDLDLIRRAFVDASSAKAKTLAYVRGYLKNNKDRDFESALDDWAAEGETE